MRHGSTVGAQARRQLLIAASTVICLAFTAAACGGGSPTAGVASLSTTTTTVATRGPSSGGLVVYARCMRAHGILSFPEPASLGSSSAIKAFKVQISTSVASSPQFQTAQRACARYAPQQTPPEQITTEDQADYLKAATCMRNHGIVGFPDPVFSGGQVDFPIPKGMNANSIPFRRAREICEKLIPAGLPYSKEAEGGA
jgi:hypothetical protein